MTVFEKELRRLFPTLYKQQQELRRQNDELRGAVERLSRSLAASESALRRQNARAAPSYRLGRALTAPLRAIRRLRKN